MKRPVLITHLTSLHAGSIDLIRRRANEVEGILFVDDDLAFKLSPVKEILRIPAKEICHIVHTMRYACNNNLGVLTLEKLADFKPDEPLLVTNDSVCRALVAKYLQDNPVEWDTTFLHWDQESVQSESTVKYDREIAVAQLGTQIVDCGMGEGSLTSDVFRRVGVVLFRDGKILLSAHNEHMPSDQTPYTIGDPRSFVEAGSNVHICGAIHGEANVIAMAAKAGISTDGASVYQTVFPCVPCAYQLIVAGIKACYYSTGNAYLNVDETLRARGVEMIYVQP